MLLVSLLDPFAELVSLVGSSEKTSLDVFLGVIPSTTGVGGGEGNLDSRDNGTGKEARGELVAEEESSEERRHNDNSTGGNHLSEGSVGGDGDALLVVGLGTSLDERNLSSDLSNHVLSGFSDSRHGQGREGVGKHGSEEEAGEGEGLEDVHGVSISELRAGLSNTGHEGTEESEGDEAGRADGETLSDSGGGVTGGVEGISGDTDLLVEVGHLSDSTSVVRDGAISVNGEGNGEAAEHTNGSEGNSVHSSPVEGEEDGDGEADDGDDVGEVSEGESLDDVGGSIEVASLSELLGGSVGLGGVVLSGDSNDESGPETKGNASEEFPSVGVDGLASEGDINSLGESGVEKRDKEDSHEHGGHDELDLKLVLNSHVDSGEEDSDEGSTNTESGNKEREVDGVGGLEESGGGSGNDESGAGRLGEGSEEIGAHTSDVTNVVTDVVSNGSGVLRRVLIDLLTNLTGEVSTDISSLGVDTTTDSSEKSNGGATETISRDEFEKSAGLLLESFESLLALRENTRLEGENEDLEDKESKSDESESEDLATLEGNEEALIDGSVAEVGSLDIGGGGNLHSNESSGHGGQGTDDESEGGVGEVGVFLQPGLVDSAEEEDSEENAEDSKVGVLFLEESVGTLSK